MFIRCYTGECKAAEVDAREQPCLGYMDVLLRSPSWTLARSQVLARKRVPLGPGRGHVLLGRPTQTLGLPAVRGGQQVPEVGGIRQGIRGAPPMKWEQSSDEI